MQHLYISFVIAFLILFSTVSEKSVFAQERTYEIYVCKVWLCAGDKMPLAITDVRNLQNEKWWRDLEIEVKNISDKPIYSIRLIVGLPDTGSRRSDSPMTDGMWGVSLKYGRPELGDVARRAEPTDVSIKPGESYVFKIPENVQTTFSKRSETETKRVVLQVEIVNFGDGTGIVAGGVPVSHK